VQIPPRLRWRCRRGTQELDRLLLRFLERRYPELSPEERAGFEELLTREDDLLQDWLILGRDPEAPALAALVRRIRTEPA
jgi:antitoxin CptB